MPLAILAGAVVGLITAAMATETTNKAINQAVQNGYGCNIHYKSGATQYSIELIPPQQPVIDPQALRKALEIYAYQMAQQKQLNCG